MRGAINDGNKQEGNELARLAGKNRTQTCNADLQCGFAMRIWIAGPSLGIYERMNRKTTHATLE
jgi:hypothetical protein